MPFGRSLIQTESLLRVSGEERSPEILISFHSSGSTSNQGRKLDQGFPVEPHFAQVVAEPEKRSGFSHSLLIVLVPLFYLFGRKSIGQVGVSTFLGLHGPRSAFIIWAISIY
jgi:hypothetical protein